MEVQYQRTYGVELSKSGHEKRRTITPPPRQGQGDQSKGGFAIRSGLKMKQSQMNNLNPTAAFRTAGNQSRKRTHASVAFQTDDS
jgi:hypothetical protein